MCTVNYNNHDITVKVTFFLYLLVQDVSDTLGIQNSISYILSTWMFPNVSQKYSNFLAFVFLVLLYEIHIYKYRYQ